MSGTNKDSPILISLVIATLGRVEVLQTLFSSLEKQKFKAFEVIVVDQNTDHRIKHILDAFKSKFPIKHIYSDTVGSSLNRNLGAHHAISSVIGFPDDDCWYAEDLLSYVWDFFELNSGFIGLLGKTVDILGHDSIAPSPNKSSMVTPFKAVSQTIEPSMFFRTRDFMDVGGFDTEFGIGSHTSWQSHPGDDLVFRLLDRGLKIYYDAEFSVFHPKRNEKNTGHALEREKLKAPALGALFRKHNRGFLWLYYCFRSFGGLLLSMLRLDAPETHYYLIRLKGRIQGWFAY